MLECNSDGVCPFSPSKESGVGGGQKSRQVVLVLWSVGERGEGGGRDREREREGERESCGEERGGEEEGKGKSQRKGRLTRVCVT